MPLDNVTREEFVKMLALVFELETEKTGAFSDVEAGAWYAPLCGRRLESGACERRCGRCIRRGTEHHPAGHGGYDPARRRGRGPAPGREGRA